MIYFINRANFLESLSYQNNYQILSNAKAFNSSNLINSNRPGKQVCVIEPKAKMAPALAGRDGNGCDSPVVRIGACGASDPGSNPGRGPKPFSKRFAKNASQKRFAKNGNCYAVAGD